MLGLIPLALSLAPAIGSFLFGPAAAKTTAAVTQLAASVTGLADPAAAAQALADPAQASAFQLELAKLAAQLATDQRSADLATLQAGLADTLNARATTVALVADGSPVAWGAPVVSAVVLTIFAGVMALAFTYSPPPAAAPLINVMLGSLTAMATAVVSYWVGSSAGSKTKDDTIAAQSRSLAASTPPGAGP